MRRPISYANVVSTLALVLALSGTAYAAATITGKDVKNGSLTGRDVKTNSVTGKDVKDRSIRNGDVGKGLLPGAAAAIRNGAATVIPTAKSDLYVFDTEIYDTAKMFDGGGYIRIPQDGTYALGAAITYLAAGKFQRQVRILINDQVSSVGIVNVDGSTISVSTAVTVPLVAGDRISLGTYNGGPETTVAEFVGDAPDALLTVQMVSP